MRLREFRDSLDGPEVSGMFGCIVLRRNGVINNWCSNDFRLRRGGVEFTVRLAAGKANRIVDGVLKCVRGLEHAIYLFITVCRSAVRLV